MTQGDRLGSSETAFFRVTDTPLRIPISNQFQNTHFTLNTMSWHSKALFDDDFGGVFVVWTLPQPPIAELRHLCSNFGAATIEDCGVQMGTLDVW